MKKYSTIILLSAGLLLAACGEKDVAYYSEHIDKAEEKIEQCKQDLKKAIAKKDKAEFEKMAKDAQCQAAKTAIREHKERQYELEKQQREAEKKAKFEATKAEIAKQYTGLNWQQAIAQYANSECAKSIFLSGTCQAEEAVYQEYVDKGKAELAQYSFQQLMDKENDYCAKDKRRYSACSVWGEAVIDAGEKVLNTLAYPDFAAQKEQYCSDNRPYNHPACTAWEKVDEEKEKELVAQYIANYEQLRQDFNQCVDKTTAVKNNYLALSKIRSSYPCKQALQAYQQLKLGYDFGEKME